MKEFQRARKNTMATGVSPEEFYKSQDNRLKGVEMGRTDVVKTEGVNPGVPMLGTFDDPTACAGITKKGAPCQAPLVKGEFYCVGHLRGQRRNTESN